MWNGGLLIHSKNDPVSVGINKCTQLNTIYFFFLDPRAFDPDCETMATPVPTERVLVFDPRYTLVLLNAPSSFKSKQDSQQGEDMRAAQHVRTLFKHLGLLSPKDGKSVVKFSTPPVRIPRAQTPKKCQGRELSILLAFTNESDVRKVRIYYCDSLHLCLDWHNRSYELYFRRSFEPGRK